MRVCTEWVPISNITHPESRLHYQISLAVNGVNSTEIENVRFSFLPTEFVSSCLSLPLMMEHLKLFEDECF